MYVYVFIMYILCIWRTLCKIEESDCIFRYFPEFCMFSVCVVLFLIVRLSVLRKTILTLNNMSLVMRKPSFCMCENKDADQLRGNREADQRLCFRYTDSTIPLLPKYEISSLYPSSVAVQAGLCRTWSETPETGFLTTRLICVHV